MRHPLIAFSGACLALLVAGCGTNDAAPEVDRAAETVDDLDDGSLSEIMLAVADPAESVTYFRRAAEAEPGRLDLKRALAQSLVRARRPAEAATVLEGIVDTPGATAKDRVDLADALIRAGDWTGAQTQMAAVPPEVESYERYKLDAMIADSTGRWDDADAFYAAAAARTTTPAGILNNWGYSKLTRGAHAEAEALFARALESDPSLFTAKNNMALARGAQRNYDLPVVPMTQTERAQLLHTLALAAIKSGDVATGRGLLREAVDTHPQHFEAAARALDALDAGIAG